ncbi:MAG: tripartite tricarboxylate transporter substrate binding protein [Burkholderiales bacterium]|nr:tripartite tricarboxylate transporter substrate binding protein [Burkholderiales bacterium]
MHRRLFRWAVLGAAALAGAAHAQLPDRPMRMLVGAPAGGPTDIVARVLVDRIAPALGRTIVIDNRAGAGGNIATQALVQAPADGTTLFMGSFANAVNPAMMNVPYDTRRDLLPVSQVTRVPLVVVVPSGLAATSVAELVALARRAPGTLNIASGGVGTSAHLAAELFKRMAGVDMPIIQYKGGGPALQDVMAARAQVAFDNMQTSLPQLPGGKIRMLAVTTEKRLAEMPAMPTVSETPGLRDFVVLSWHGVFMRSGTPGPIVERIAREIAAACASRELRERFAQLQIEAIGNTPEEFARFFHGEMDTWGRVVREAGIRAE